MPLNGARLPVAFLSNTAITNPFPWRVVAYNFIKCDSCSILVIVSREDVLSSISTDGVSISWHRRNKPGTIISHVDSLSSVRYCHRAISNECYDAMCLIYLSHACGCCLFIPDWLR